MKSVTLHYFTTDRFAGNFLSQIRIKESYVSHLISFPLHVDRRIFLLLFKRFLKQLPDEYHKTRIKITSASWLGHFEMVLSSHRS